MLKTYFFIPANNPRFLAKSQNISADYLIFDLEDSVLPEEFGSCLQNLSNNPILPNYYVRFRFFDEENQLREKEFTEILNVGFKHFIIPKFKDIKDADAIHLFLEKRNICDVDFIILIEDPYGLLSLFETLKNSSIKITGLGLGSHDYSNSMGMLHTNENLYFAKQMILNHGKAFHLDVIDTVSVNIENDIEFKEDSIHGFRMGFNGKFLIHPRQLKIVQEIIYYSDEEVEEAIKVYPKIMQIKDRKAAIFNIDGKVYEKPHIDRIIKIINWKDKYGNK